jgi:superfamily I DNA/RNA helicase
LVSTGELTGTAISAAQAFRDLCQALSSQDPDLIANKLREHLAIESPELREKVHTFILQLDESDQEDAINALCDTLIPESAPPSVDPCAVLCLTMHGSKGLTKRTVVMPGLEDAWLPGDATENEMDERKRLFYVALTRATDQVLITCPRTRPYKDPLSYGAPGSGRVCRFVNRKTVIIHR